MTNRPITIAYYLGQFHPLEENNQFWGDGFTEWHNVARARPLFPKHKQPVLPGRFGFYDLRCEETLLAQLNYAKEIKIDAFCYWHYWFAGKRVLHLPLDRMLTLPDVGIKIMLGWANESWTGIWHGLSHHVIFQQTYNRDELREHAKLIAKYVNSERYLKIGNMSPFLIYKPRLIPDAKNYLDELRENVKKNGGGDLYIIGTWGPAPSERIDRPSDYGLDAVVANNVGVYFKSPILDKAYRAFWRVARKFGFGPEIRPYTDTIKVLRAAFGSIEGTVHAQVVTGWDNTPRMGRRGLVLIKYNEQTFRLAIRTALSLEKRNKIQLLFVKSWNEWAEQNVLEPKFKEYWSAGRVFAETLSKAI
ncbi:MAG: glycoside hydrolase family 99-like domain-containing protein [candidate division WOR-3 bacterium]